VQGAEAPPWLYCAAGGAEPAPFGAGHEAAAFPGALLGFWEVSRAPPSPLFRSPDAAQFAPTRLNPYQRVPPRRQVALGLVAGMLVVPGGCAEAARAAGELCVEEAGGEVRAAAGGGGAFAVLARDASAAVRTKLLGALPP